MRGEWQSKDLTAAKWARDQITDEDGGFTCCRLLAPPHTTPHHFTPLHTAVTTAAHTLASACWDASTPPSFIRLFSLLLRMPVASVSGVAPLAYFKITFPYHVSVNPLGPTLPEVHWNIKNLFRIYAWKYIIYLEFCNHIIVPTMREWPINALINALMSLLLLFLFPYWYHYLCVCLFVSTCVLRLVVDVCAASWGCLAQTVVFKRSWCLADGSNVSLGPWWQTHWPCLSVAWLCLLTC